MKSHELIEALENGKYLEKVHHNDSECIENFHWKKYQCGDKNCNVPIHHYFETHGWGSAYGQAKDRILDILENPEKWRIKE